MPDQNEQNAESLRAAVAWALQLADEQGETLIAAFLADALHFTEQALEQSRA